MQIRPTLSATAMLLTSLALAPSAAPVAQTTSADRLFLGFIEDARIADRQWWEGQLEYRDGEDNVPDAIVVRGIVAFQPWDNVEIGGRAGFGETDTPPSLPEGSGATDLDAWGKYVWPRVAERLDLTAGAIVTVPTGDDTAGLGTDAFAAAGFGALRYRFDEFSLNARGGVRFNEDGMIFGIPLEGETSIFFGAAAVWPQSDRVSLIGEFAWETERFENFDNDGRLLGGINWRVTNRGMARGAIGLGFGDGAPDFQILAGWAAQF